MKHERLTFEEDSIEHTPTNTSTVDYHPTTNATSSITTQHYIASPYDMQEEEQDIHHIRFHTKISEPLEKLETRISVLEEDDDFLKRKVSTMDLEYHEALEKNDFKTEFSPSHNRTQS